jgi:16S rRNA (adenine1518-N6/adenine1519-N6)-dimethyltransferase
VQNEVAERLRAGAGSDAYGVLSIMAQMLAEVEVLRQLPPQAFWPAPKVDSALVRLVRRDRLGPDAGDFSLFVMQLFSARRKMLRKALSGVTDTALEAIAAVGLDPQARPEQVGPEQFLALYQVVRHGTEGRNG